MFNFAAVGVEKRFQPIFWVKDCKLLGGLMQKQYLCRVFTFYCFSY